MVSLREGAEAGNPPELDSRGPGEGGLSSKPEGRTGLWVETGLGAASDGEGEPAKGGGLMVPRCQPQARPGEGREGHPPSRFSLLPPQSPRPPPPPIVQSGALKSKAGWQCPERRALCSSGRWPPPSSLWAVLRQIPRGPPPFPPFLPQSRGARQAARAGPNRAPTRPASGPSCGAWSGSRHHRPQHAPAGRLPFLAAPGAGAAAVRAPGMPVPRRLHLWGPVPGSHPPGCASAPPAQPRRARPEGRRVPRGQPCAQTHRPTVPARYLRVRAPAPRPAAGPPLPRPFPSRKPRAPSSRARGGQSVRTRPPTGLGRAPAPGPALAAPPPAGLGPRPVNSSREAGRRSQRRGAPKGGDRAAPPARPAASDGPPPPARDPRDPRAGPRLTCRSRAGSRCLGGRSRSAPAAPLTGAPCRRLRDPRCPRPAPPRGETEAPRSPGRPAGTRAAGLRACRYPRRGEAATGPGRAAFPARGPPACSPRGSLSRATSASATPPSLRGAPVPPGEAFRPRARALSPPRSPQGCPCCSVL